MPIFTLKLIISRIFLKIIRASNPSRCHPVSAIENANEAAVGLIPVYDIVTTDS